MSSLLAIGDRDEIARHIVDFGLMHDPEYAEMAAIVASGPGFHSQQLRAMMMSPDQPAAEPSSSKPVAPPLPAEAYRFPPMSEQEQMRTNPFYRAVS